MVAQFVYTEKVGGSNPSSPTIEAVGKLTKTSIKPKKLQLFEEIPVILNQKVTSFVGFEDKTSFVKILTTDSTKILTKTV